MVGRRLVNSIWLDGVRAASTDRVPGARPLEQVGEGVEGAPRGMIVLEHEQPFHPVSVRLVEGAVEELGAELVEAMPRHVVGGRRHQQVPSDLHHVHQAAESGCELEDVLEGPAVDDHVERLVPAVRRRPVQVVHDARALVVGVVELIQLQRAERAEKLIRDVRAAADRSGPVPLLRALDEPSRRELPGQPQRARRQGLTADRERALEADSRRPRLDQEARRGLTNRH